MIVDRPTVREVVPLARRLFTPESEGCCLHIVLSDTNITDQNVDCCIAQALHLEHWECLAVAKQLRSMTKSQRCRVGDGVYRLLSDGPGTF